MTPEQRLLLEPLNTDGMLDHIYKFDTARRFGLMKENQKRSFHPSRPLYNKTLLHALWRIYTENFAFNSLVGFNALGFETLLADPHTPLDRIPLNTEFCIEEWFDRPYERLNEEERGEIASIVSSQIFNEYEQLVFSDIRENIGIEVEWDVSASPGECLREKYEGLYLKMVEVTNQMQAKLGKEDGEFCVLMWEDHKYIFFSWTAGFAPTPSEGFASYLPFDYLGVINNRWRAYSGYNFPKDEMIIAYRGEESDDAGIVYRSHTPFEMEKDLVITGIPSIDKALNERGYRRGEFISIMEGINGRTDNVIRTNLCQSKVLKPNVKDYYARIKFRNWERLQ